MLWFRRKESKSLDEKKLERERRERNEVNLRLRRIQLHINMIKRSH